MSFLPRILYKKIFQSLDNLMGWRWWIHASVNTDDSAMIQESSPMGQKVLGEEASVPSPDAPLRG